MRPPDLRQVIEAVYAQEIARADEAKRHLFEPIGPLEGKVVAATADGTVGLSGWGHERDYPQMTDAVRIRAVEIRHPLEPHPFDDAFDGQYHASHAEKQVAELARDQPIAVSREMCEDC